MIFAGESASCRGTGAAVEDSLPALSLSGAPAPSRGSSSLLKSPPRYSSRSRTRPLSEAAAGDPTHPSGSHPCRTHLVALRSLRHVRNWVPARTRSCSRSSCAARCRTERRPRHCPAPTERADRAQAAGLFGHPESLPRRCHRRLPRRRLLLRRRCRCAPGLQTASWALLRRARRAPAGSPLGSQKLQPQRQPGRGWSGAGRPVGCGGLRGSFLGSGRSGSLCAVRTRLWLQEPPPGSPPQICWRLGWGQSSSGGRACPPSARLAGHNAERKASRRATAAFL